MVIEHAVFDATASMRTRVAARYTGTVVDAAAETDAACWAAIRAGVIDPGHLYWITRSAVAQMVRRETQRPAGDGSAATTPDHAEHVVDKVDAAAMLRRLPTPPCEVVDLVFKRRHLTATERSRAYRWLARQRRVAQARAS